MATFSDCTVKIIDTHSNIETCPCCRCEIEESSPDYIKLSCNHQYHYDCIYDAFVFNKNRGSKVLECPYCRASVQPLPELDGFEFSPEIHIGGIVTKFQNNWIKEHLGKSHCVCNIKGLYCNRPFVSGHGVDNKYCYYHRNFGHKGNGWCSFQKNYEVCNKKVISEGANFCPSHHKYEGTSPCKYVYTHGQNKGELCKSLTKNSDCLCDKHMKYKSKMEVAMNVTETKCISVTKSGKNKGNICGKQAVNGGSYCGIHLKKHETNDKTHSIDSISSLTNVKETVNSNTILPIIPEIKLISLEKSTVDTLRAFIDKGMSVMEEYISDEDWAELNKFMNIISD